MSTTDPGRDAEPRTMRELVWWALSLHPVLVTGWLVALLATCASTMVLPRTIGWAFDTLNREPWLVDRVFVILAIPAATLGVVTGIRIYFISRLGDTVVSDIKQRLYGHALTLDAAFFDRVSGREIASRLAVDLTALQGLLGANTSLALRCLITLVGAVVMLYLTSPTLGAWSLFIVPAAVLPFRLRAGAQRAMAAQTNAEAAEANQLAGEMLSAIRCVHAHSREGYEQTRYRGRLVRAVTTAERLALVRSALTALSTVVLAVGIVAVLRKGAALVAAGALSFGDVAQFALYGGMAGWAGLQLLEVWAGLDRMRGSLERLDWLVGVRPGVASPPHGAVFPHRPPAIAFDGVGFTYPSGAQRALQDFSVLVPAGATVALVGPSGAGKSTLRALLQRFYDPQQGAISIDGTDLREFDLQTLRRGVAVVPQAPWLMHGTIAENIAFGEPTAPQERVIAAAHACGIHAFVESLPDGYDTVVGDGGMELSVGQRQLIAIARACLADAPVVVFDEATSALDALSEELVKAAMRAMRARSTVLVIAHRLATIVEADTIVIVDQGQAIAAGTHAELVRTCPLYREMAQLQFLCDTRPSSFERSASLTAPLTIRDA